MSDFQKYKKRRMQQDPDFWAGYDERFETFRIGILLKQARLEAGLTQEEMENHAMDIRLSTLEKFAEAVGRKIHVALR